MSELEFSIEAPCKVMLHGEVAENFRKTAIVAAGNLKTVLTLSVPEDQPENEIHLVLTDSDENYVFDIDMLTKFLLQGPLPLRKSRSLISSMNLEDPDLIDSSYLLLLVRRYSGTLDLPEEVQNSILAFLILLSGMFSCVSVPIEKFLVTVSTEIPLGTGLGASASFSTCVSAALLHLIRLRVGSRQEMSRDGYRRLQAWCTDFNSFDEREKRIICRWACLSDSVLSNDTSEVGSTICTYGSIITYKRLGDKLSEMKMLPQPKILKILLIHAGIQEDTCNVASSLRQHYPVIMDPIFSAMDELSMIVAHILRSVGTVSLSDKSEHSQLLKLLLYKLDHLGELTDLNQSLLKALGMSHPKVDVILRNAQRYGVHGKETGYGGIYGYLLLSPLIEETKLVSIKKELVRDGIKYSEVRIGVPGVSVSNIEPQYLEKSLLFVN